MAAGNPTSIGWAGEEGRGEEKTTKTGAKLLRRVSAVKRQRPAPQLLYGSRIYSFAANIYVYKRVRAFHIIRNDIDKSFRSIGNDESVQTERFIRRGIKFTRYRCSVTSNRMNCFSFLLVCFFFFVLFFSLSPSVCLSFVDRFSAAFAAKY